MSEPTPDVRPRPALTLSEWCRLVCDVFGLTDEERWVFGLSPVHTRTCCGDPQDCSAECGNAHPRP